MTKRKKQPVHEKTKNFNFILFIGVAFLIVGALITIVFSSFYSDPDPEYPMGRLGPYISTSLEPCATFAIMFSILAILLGGFGYMSNNYELAMLASILIMLTLVIPAMILGFISLIIFFRYGFE